MVKTLIFQRLRTHKISCRGEIPQVAFFRQVELRHNNPPDRDFRRTEPRKRLQPSAPDCRWKVPDGGKVYKPEEHELR